MHRFVIWSIIMALALSLFFFGFSCEEEEDDDSKETDDDDDDSTNDDDDDDDNNDDNDDNDDDESFFPEFFNDHQFLTNTSSWFGYVHSDHKPRPRKIGEFGVGNGRAFTLVGSTLPYHTMRNTIGPDYERDPMFFSDKRFFIYSGENQAAIREQWDMRVRKTCITLTRSHYYNGLELTTIDFAPRGGTGDDDWTERAIVRIFIARNIGKQSLTDLSIEMKSTLGAMNQGVHEEHIENKHLAIKPLESTFDAKGKGTIDLGTLEPGAEIVSTLLFAFTFDGENPEDVFTAIKNAGPENLLDETHTWWADWYDQGALLTTPDEKFNDLLESLQVTIKTQQAFTGATCVMSEYTRTWTRDTTGPVRYYTRMGRNNDVKDMLDYYYMAALDRGDISNSMDSNKVWDTMPGPVDWRSKGTMSGRLAAEGPSYIPLQYGDYFDYTGDLATIGERYEMMLHAVMHQDFRHDCLLPFSGDETFRELMGAGYGYLIGMTTYEDNWLSLNSSVLFTAAADRMAFFADLLGETVDLTWYQDKAQQVRDCTEQYYWLDTKGYYAATIDINTLEPVARPYEDSNTKPLWSGAESADDPHQVNQILNVMNEIGHADGAAIQTPMHILYRTLLGLLDIKEGLFSGMTQGYYLENLTRIDHPKAEDAFKIWKVHCNDSGNVSEAMVRDDYGRFMYLLEPFGFLADLTSRYRPWEGGIYGAALLHYVTGFEADYTNGIVRFAPHMPDGWDNVTFADAPFGPDTLDVEITDDQNSRTFSLTNGQESFDLTLQLSVPDQITTMTVNGASVDPNDYNLEYEWGRGRVTLNAMPVGALESFTASVSY